MKLPKWLSDKRDELWAKDAPSGSYSIAAREGFTRCAELLLKENEELKAMVTDFQERYAACCKNEKELERENKRLEAKIKYLTDELDTRDTSCLDLIEENEDYRAALEFYASDWSDNIESTMGGRAKEVLAKYSKEVK